MSLLRHLEITYLKGMKNKASICVATKHINTPIQPTTASAYRGITDPAYAGYFNTEQHKALARKMAALEQCEDAMLCASGMAAISTVLMKTLKAGDHVVLIGKVYGGTLNLFSEVFEKFQVTHSLVDNLDQAEAAVQENTVLAYGETPSNPLLEQLDLERFAALPCFTVVDSTFASPMNCNPARFGVDVVIHSGTKYLSGHSDLSFGVICGPQKFIQDCIAFAHHTSPCLNAMDFYLIERSLKTLAVRMRAHNENALAIAEFLEHHPKIAQVNYPGLDSHPHKHLTARQLPQGQSGMLSFCLKDPSKTETFLDKLDFIVAAQSLGGVETIISQPSQSSHVMISAEQRAAMGIADHLLRLSVGIEDIEDLKADLKQALDVC